MAFIIGSEDLLSGAFQYFSLGFGRSPAGAGKAARLWRVLGAHATASGTAFAVWAPNARDVRLAGDFNAWQGAEHPLSRRGSGVWETFVPGVGDGCRYAYEVHGADGRWRRKADPLAFAADRSCPATSVVFTSAYRWSDTPRPARPARAPHQAPMSVYEVHLGSWRPGLGYRRLADVLPGYVAGLGFTHVQLLPVAEHAGDERLPTGLYAPTARYGGPDDFRHLVDSLHQAGVGVILDWTPRRFAPEEWGLARFDGTPLYETTGAGGPAAGTRAPAFDHGRRAVREFLVANAVFWCEEFRLDGLKIGADDSPWPGSAREGEPLFRQVNQALVALDAPAVRVAEEPDAWGGDSALTGPEGLGFDLAWNTGWTDDCLGYLGRDPAERRYHHGEVTFPMVYAYSEHYVLPVSHATGSVPGRVPGEERVRRATTRAFLGFMWAHPGKKLLFMGQEFAQEERWSPERGLRWDLADEGVRRLVRDLNAAYHGLPSLWRLDSSPGGFSWIVPDAEEENVLAFLRYDDEGTPVACVCNFSPVVREGFRVGLPFPGRWAEVINTDALPYGGSGAGNLRDVAATEAPWHGCDASAPVVLPGLSTIWLRPVSSDKVSED
ncbi:1,4-alpha-glucan branching enzyme [Sphaerisporangium fuscum]|uniref:1,4-alpha-glucan branching enzyme n=1 Tax=Sphaerisporangium fuscum TaxID=2835868 RepID=UPI001BDD4A1C|nr:1,4-alpha-glucan branching enzyme [Sphaerisporangium fuscum]